MNIPRLWELLRPMLRWVAVAIVIFMFWQALPMDMLAIAIAGDMVTYLEIAAAVWLVAQVTRVRWAAFYVRTAIHRSFRRARVRARRASRRIARLRPPSSDDDGRPAPALAFAYA
jgi:hypothetical protein